MLQVHSVLGNEVLQSEKQGWGRYGEEIYFADVTADAFPNVDDNTLSIEIDQTSMRSMPMLVEPCGVHREMVDSAAGPANRGGGGGGMEGRGRRGKGDGAFVLIRSASRALSNSDGSLGSSPEDSMIENLVWKDRDKVSLITLPEKLDNLKGSPYIGTFHHGHGAGGKPTPPKPPPVSKRRFVYRKSISDADKASSSCADIEDNMHDVEEMECSVHRSFIKEALKLEGHVPTTPELCGIQGLLPRKSGVRVLEKIGEGSFGKIVKARNDRNTLKWDSPRGASAPRKMLLGSWCKRDIVEYPHEGETLVLKCIRSACAQDAEVECIQREVRIHARCNHPNIVKMYGHYDHEAYMTIILGYVVGKELYSVLEMQRRIPEHDALPLFLQMLGATEHLHSMRVVHRDLKPRNILITPANRVYVIDLGLALDLSVPGDVRAWQDPMVGTMGYLAPEMHLQQELGLGVDVWALGVTLYETVCGFPPFQPHEIASPAVQVEFPDAEVWGIGVSKDLENLITAMLQKDPTKRITAEKAMRHAVFTPLVVAEVVAALEAPTGPSADPAEAEQHGGGAGAAGAATCEAGGAATCETRPLKLQLTQSNSIDWTGQYYFNYCLATAVPSHNPECLTIAP